MMQDLAAQFRQLVYLVLDLKRSVSKLQDYVGRALQNVQTVASAPGGGGGTTGTYWTFSGSAGFPAATGTQSGGVTPSSASLTILRANGSTETTLAASTVYWRYLTACGANKRIGVTANGDGTYDAITEDCTATPP
jgi:hypothetical protein